MSVFNSVDDYINHQPEETGKALRELKKCILAAVPDAVELFNYGIPAFALTKNGKRDGQIMIAGYKTHVGFYPHPSTIEAFTDRLTEYKQGKGSVQFPLDQPIPSDLVIEMVKYRKELISDGKDEK